MPFKSKAQRRYFYHLKDQGKMDQKTIDEWEEETPDDLPEEVEKKAFWAGFDKQAAMLDGKGFHSGPGKGQIEMGANLRGHAREGAKETPKTDKTLLDRERGPRDFGVGEQGPEFYDEATHVRY